MIYGKPVVRDICIVSGKSVAKSRDDHYHNPPDYLVVEPNDTSERTRNLQQTNTNGYKLQGNSSQFKEAEQLVKSWKLKDMTYSPLGECQKLVQTLMAKYPYRLDTNFAKIDRIAHQGIEQFKANVLSSDSHGMTIQSWAQLLASGDDVTIKNTLSKHLKIKW